MSSTLQLVLGAVAGVVLFWLFVHCAKALLEGLLAWREDKWLMRGDVWDVDGLADEMTEEPAVPVKLAATPRSRPSSLAERAWSGR